jgi:hypothetical protein
MLSLLLFVLFAACSCSSLSLKQFGAINKATDFGSAKQNAIALENAFRASSAQHLPVVVNEDEDYTFFYNVHANLTNIELVLNGVFRIFHNIEDCKQTHVFVPSDFFAFFSFRFVFIFFFLLRSHATCLAC